MDLEGFGNCSWFGECQEACPKDISIDVIKQMNHDYMTAVSHGAKPSSGPRAPKAGAV
jgi:succinate dehydrogenase / fumarate reductase iron-sulfur subunit